MNFTNVKYEIDKERKEKPNMKILSYWAIVSFLGIIITQDIIRPRHIQLSETFDFLQGTLPNFFAGSGFFALAFVYYRAFYRTGNSLNRRLIFAFIFSFLGLTLWEFVRYFMDYPIDYFDILMTLIGNVFTIIIILMIRIK